MYFITAAGRNYNIAISPRAGAPGGTSAAFTSRLESCNGPTIAVDCDITIDFNWDAGGAGSGTGQVTIVSGSSTASTIPAPGNALINIEITSLTHSCTSYNSVFACPFPTTTTTTTTTSTTTTTTTVAPASYSDPIIKHDQYSSSFGAITVSVWENLGTGGTDYKLFKSTLASTNTGGSGTGVFLGLTGSFDEDFFSFTSTLYLPFSELAYLDLYDLSFSYACVFKVEAPSSGYTIARINASNSVNGFSIFGGSDKFGPFIKPTIYKPGSDPFNPIIRISPTPKFYLGVLTFDKTAGSSDAAKFYLNGLINSFPSIPSPSTFFISDTYNYNLGITLNPVKLAAAAFWENTVLTQAQVQSLYNEYNLRYTLG